MSRLLCLSLLMLSVASGCSEPAPAPVPENADFLEAIKAPFERGKSGAVLQVDLRNQELSDDLLRSVASLRNLKILNLADTQITDAQVALLSDAADTLLSIDLRNCPVSNDAMKTVGQFKSLQGLTLSGRNNACTVDDDGLAFLNQLPELRILALDDLWISNTGLESLKASTGLEELCLANTTVDDDGLAFLSGFAQLQRLRLA
ncbi:MAG: hypothetical protein KDA96_09200, partial [Planctomycetaceae bacterium]|nr:hypothetical protein [Planctomycetaceae bacterium]